MKAYDYDAQRWVFGDEARAVRTAQLREALEILEGPRGQEYCDMHEPAVKHTPGPWQADGRLVLARFGLADQTIVAECPRWDDARLIASAPDLFAALRKIAALNGSTGGAPALVAEFHFIARAAIARAEGK